MSQPQLAPTEDHNLNEFLPRVEKRSEADLLPLYDGFACSDSKFRTVDPLSIRQHLESRSSDFECPPNNMNHDLPVSGEQNARQQTTYTQVKDDDWQFELAHPMKSDFVVDVESTQSATSEAASEAPGFRRILFIDAFDSFTNNIVGLLEQALDTKVSVVHIDDEEVAQDFKKVLAGFDAVVVGPGPGHPSNEKDVGIIRKLWELDEDNILPVFGVCLGFQSLCHTFGAEVERLALPRHGIISNVTHTSQDIFAGLGTFHATQYHSLRAVIGDDKQRGQVFWEPSQTCPSLQPLAWDDSDEGNGPILMGVKHTTKPFWGVQFHPESICTSPEALDLITNWWTEAQHWLAQRSRNVSGSFTEKEVFVPQAKQSAPCDAQSHFTRELLSVVNAEDILLRWGVHHNTHATPTTLIEALGYNKEEVILLDSQGHASGRYSIMGLVVPGKSMKVTYGVADHTLRYQLAPGRTSSAQLESIDDVWPMFQQVLDLHKPRNGPQRAFRPGAHYNAMDRFVEGHLPMDSPFWGGFMGYVAYEAGLATIDVLSKHESHGPDINFAFVHRTIIFDHEKSNIYVQSLLPGDWDWILRTGITIDGLDSQAVIHSSRQPLSNELSSLPELLDESLLGEMLSNAKIVEPEESTYRANVLLSQTFLASGDSYELCFTDKTQIDIPAKKGKGLDEWSLYKRLRRNNPAPFGAFMRLSNSVVVGSSPERFLRWNRDGHCQFRPIKGTVKKGGDMTREKAHAILNSSKERAENLMIVDLIRHDLSGVIGAENVQVPQLMVVEEYKTVYQLVSVIEGALPAPGPGKPRGLDILKSSLPPGSMTGAPKKRSCEILQNIERQARGIYSGVLGYMDVGGAGDFSVVIRTAMKHDDSSAPSAAQLNGNGSLTPTEKSGNERIQKSETWYVGAGGAVTIQSTDEGEYLEMKTKSSSVMGALFPHLKG